MATTARSTLPRVAAARDPGIAVQPRGGELVWLPNSVLSICVALAIFTYALLTSSPSRESDLWALAFQLACWGIGVALLAFRQPLGQLRFSDPAVLVALWSVLYFLIPSVMWVQAATLPFDNDLVGQAPARLFVLHGVFLIALFAVYAVTTSRRSYFSGPVCPESVISGWPLFVLSFVPVGLTVLQRVVTTGQVLPDQTYGDQVFAAYDAVNAARDSGGLLYVLVQIGSKVDFYPLLAAGIGGGLVLASASLRREGFARTLAIVLSGVVVVLFLSNSGRHYAFMVLLIALVVADALAGPIRWRILALYLPVALLVFEFMGYFRAYRNLDFTQGVQTGYQQFASADSSDRMFEYTLMLGKEAAGLRIFDRPEGAGEIVNEVLAVLPSQVNPAKLNWMKTDEILSRDMLGEFADKGAGVAGSMIADGYRVGGILGVAGLGAFLGCALAGLQRWGTAGQKPGQFGPVLLRLLLICGFYGWTFDVIRGDLNGLLSALVYNVALIWLVASKLLDPACVWLARIRWAQPAMGLDKYRSARE